MLVYSLWFIDPKKEKRKTNNKTEILGWTRWPLHSHHLSSIAEFSSSIASLPVVSLWYYSVFYLEIFSLLQQRAATLTKAGGLMRALSQRVWEATMSKPGAEGAAPKISLWNNNVIDCKDCFLTTAGTVTKWFTTYKKRKESEQKEKPKNHKTTQHSNIHLEYTYLKCIKWSGWGTSWKHEKEKKE